MTFCTYLFGLASDGEEMRDLPLVASPPWTEAARPLPGSLGNLSHIAPPIICARESFAQTIDAVCLLLIIRFFLLE
jgi:hypothetical protein